METLTKPWAPTEEALRDFIANFINIISPKLNTISENLYNVQVTALSKKEEISESTKKDMEMFKICSDQILKCSCLMASIFKAEISTSTIAEETRNWVLDRIFWCFDKLEKLHLSMSTTKKNKKPSNLLNYNDFNIFVGDSFVTWVDDTLKILDTFESLFETDSQYSTLNRSDKQIFNNKCCLGLFNFHKAVGELIFAAMNIRQNCLPSEQHIINARCHVVLRETKNLMNELSTNSHLILIENDELESGHIILKNELHFPTIRMFIDVLRDGIYILEASVNRAVLSLVLKCLTDPVKPLNDIRKWQSDELDKLIETSDPKQLEKAFKPKDLAEMRESSALIKEFDMHNEQIIQIGLFAISCSSDKQRVLQLKSCLASLEVLEAHLIPSVLIDAQCLHTDILANHWIKEINMLRTCVFLIVDPVAFTDLVKEQFLNKMMHLKEMNTLESVSVCHLIDLGQCVLDYFTSYFEYEPNVLQKYEKLHSIVADIVKVVKECKAVVDLFLSNSDIKVIENPTSSNESNKDARVLKRLKLLYSLISKLSQEFVEKDESSEIFDDEETSHTLSDNSSNAPKCKTPDNATVNSKVPNKAKGIFKIFDLFKVGNKCSNSSLKTIDKTYTRSTIMRANKFKTNRQHHIILQPNNINETVVIKPTNEYMSASGILNCTDTEYALANISGFDNIEKVNETENSEVTQKNLDSLVNKRNNTTMKKSKFYKERINGLKKRRNSLRRRVILNETNKKKFSCFKDAMEDSLESRSLDELDESFDLQITEILEQITTMSDTMSLLKMETTQRTNLVDDDSQCSENVKNTTEEPANVLTLRVNKTEHVSPKRVWNIRVYDENVTDLKLSDSGSNKRLVKDGSSDTVDDIENMHATPKIAKKLSVEPDNLTPVNENVDCEIDISHGSDISTPERLNDLHLLEKKLAALKDFWDKNNAKK